MTAPKTSVSQFSWFTSKTIWGALLTVFGYLTQPGVLSVLPEKIAAVVTSIGVVLAAIGVRTAIAKSAVGVVQLHPLTLILPLLLLAPVLPSTPLTLESNGYCTPVGSSIDCFGAAGDSLKYVIQWKQPIDTVSKGKVDSTFYKLTASKGVTFYGSTGLTAPNVAVRRKFTTALADSLKLVKPALGDSVTFQITGFIQCRQGDCSIPGSAAWKYRETYAPAPASPTIRIETF